MLLWYPSSDLKSKLFWDQNRTLMRNTVQNWQNWDWNQDLSDQRIVKGAVLQLINIIRCSTIIFIKSFQKLQSLCWEINIFGYLMHYYSNMYITFGSEELWQVFFNFITLHLLDISILKFWLNNVIFLHELYSGNNLLIQALKNPYLSRCWNYTVFHFDVRSFV